MSVTLRTPKFRVSFPQVLAPKKDKSGKEKYSIMCIFDHEAQQTAEYKALVKEINDQAKERFPKGFPKNFKNPIKTADKMTRDDGTRYSGFEDDRTVAINAQSNYAPDVLNRDKQAITDEKLFYAGCYAMAMVTPKAFEHTESGSKGVTVYLGNIIKVAEGESLGGRRDGKSDFADVEIEVEELSDEDFLS